MEKIKFDSGIKEYELGSGVLRFNPGDLNVYARFKDAAKRIQEVEKRWAATAESIAGSETDMRTKEMDMFVEYDRECKEILNGVFRGNDFDQIMGGVNLMTVDPGDNRPLIFSLLEGIAAVMQEAVKRYSDGQVAAAVSQAQQNRALRRVQARK